LGVIISRALSRFKEEDAERREGDEEGEGLVVPGDGVGMHSSAVTHIASTVTG